MSHPVEPELVDSLRTSRYVYWTFGLVRKILFVKNAIDHTVADLNDKIRWNLIILIYFN